VKYTFEFYELNNISGLHEFINKDERTITKGMLISESKEGQFITYSLINDRIVATKTYKNNARFNY